MDTDGNQNVGFLDNGDYLDYYINVAQSGIYQIDFRTAAESEMGGVELQLIDENGNARSLESFTFPATGGWQTWNTTTESISLPAGQLHLRVVIKQSLFNINWFEFTYLSEPPPIQFLPVPGRIEAEAYETQSGIELENTTDDGGGQNIGFLDEDDYLDYYIDVAVAGNYLVDFRTAALSEEGAIEMQLIDDNDNVTVLGNVTFPSTGGWQDWTNTSTSIDLPAGQLHIRIVIKQPLFNINWFEFSLSTSTKDLLQLEEILLFPNPVLDQFTVKGSLETPQHLSLSIVNLAGQVIQKKDLGLTQDIEVKADNGKRVTYKLLKQAD